MRSSSADELAGLGAIFSFLVPGLGHLFIGAWARAGIWFAGWLLVIEAGGGTVHLGVMALMVVAGIDVLLYGRFDAE